MEDLRFEVLYKDTVTASVEIKENKAHIRRFDDCPIHYLFPKEEMDLYGVLEILEGRCVPHNRVNVDDLLRKLGLKNYPPSTLYVKRTVSCEMITCGSGLRGKICNIMT